MQADRFHDLSPKEALRGRRCGPRSAAERSTGDNPAGHDRRSCRSAGSRRRANSQSRRACGRDPAPAPRRPAASCCPCSPSWVHRSTCPRERQPRARGAADARRRLERRPAAQPSSELVTVLRSGRARGGAGSPTSTSPPSICCWRSRPQAAAPATRCAPPAPPTSGCSRRSREVRGPHRVTDQNPEEKYQALERFGRDLTTGGRAGQARPGDRPRRGDPPRHPGALAAHQEQPRADRRAGRRQDRDRRGPGPADRLRRRPRVAARPARDRARHRLR